MVQDSKIKIVEQAIQILSRNPQSSMEQISEKLGISRATLYRHFQSRQELLKEIILNSYNILKNNIEPILESDMPADKKLEKFIKDYVPKGARYYFLIFNDIFLGDMEIDALYKSQNNYFEKLSILLKNEGFVRQTVPDEWFATALEYMIYGAWEKIFQGDIAVNKAPDLILNTLLYGLG